MLPTAPGEAPPRGLRADDWARVLVGLAALLFAVEAARQLPGVARAYERVVAADGPGGAPSAHALLWLVAGLARLVTAYAAAAGAWARRRWAPRAVVAWGAAELAAELGFALHGGLGPSAAGRSAAAHDVVAAALWYGAAVAALCWAAAALLRRALAELPERAPARVHFFEGVWPRGCLLVAGAPAALLGAVMLIFLPVWGLELLPLVELAAFPVLIVLLKLSVDRALGLGRRAPRVR
jgi:hypothetical protein